MIAEPAVPMATIALCHSLVATFAAFSAATFASYFVRAAVVLVVRSVVAVVVVPMATAFAAICATWASYHSIRSFAFAGTVLITVPFRTAASVATSVSRIDHIDRGVAE